MCRVQDRPKDGTRSLRDEPHPPSSRCGATSRRIPRTLEMVIHNIRAIGLAAVLSSSGMLFLSYAWHGMVVNDLRYLGDGPAGYLFLHWCGYLTLGVALTFLQMGLLQLDRPQVALLAVAWTLLSGMASGALLGFALFIVPAHLNTDMTLAEAWPELVWQMTEQAVGGSLAGTGLLLHDEPMDLDLESGP